MIILTLDISSVNTGFSIFKNGQLDAYGCIPIVKNQTDAEKLIYFKLKVLDIINKNLPEKILVEDIWLKNVKTYKVLARYQGVLLELAHPISVEFLKTTEIRTTLGCGKSKEEAFSWFLNFSKWDLNFEKDNDKVDAILIGMAYEKLLKEGNGKSVQNIRRRKKRKSKRNKKCL